MRKPHTIGAISGAARNFQDRMRTDCPPQHKRQECIDGLVDELKDDANRLRPGGLECGHLNYHLVKLSQAGLIAKAEDGRYVLTDKGSGVMSLVKRLYEA